MNYFRFLKEQQEERKLKKKKRLKEKNKVVKILTFVVQLIMASAVVLITIYFIF